MKKILFLAALLTLLSWPCVAQDIVSQPDAVSAVDVVAGAPLTPPLDPAMTGTADQALAALGDLLDAAGGNSTLAIVAAAIFALLSLLKIPVVKSWVTKLIPLRWFSVVAVALGVLWMVVSEASTAGWGPALVNGLLAGGGAVALQEVLVQALQGKDAKRKAALAAALAAGDLAKAKALL